MSLGHADPRRRLSYCCAAAIAVAVVASTAASTSVPSKGTAFSGGRAYADLRHIVGCGPRPSGSPAPDRIRAYIKRRLDDAGLKTDEQPFGGQTPPGPG